MARNLAEPCHNYRDYYMNAPKISVIIPCYNYARFLPQAVESVLKQSCQDFEIIIVNDGSTDNSKQIAEALIRKYPKHEIRLINEPNKGVSTARNIGIKNARRVYSAFGR